MCGPVCCEPVRTLMCRLNAKSTTPLCRIEIVGPSSVLYVTTQHCVHIFLICALYYTVNYYYTTVLDFKSPMNTFDLTVYAASKSGQSKPNANYTIILHWSNWPV